MANIYKEFEKLLPKKKRFIAQVNTGGVNATNSTVNVTLLTGDVLTVKGSNVIEGQKYVIENGAIRDKVPTLSEFTITI